MGLDTLSEFRIQAYAISKERFPPAQVPTYSKLKQIM
jgi:hypothetical protein